MLCINSTACLFQTPWGETNRITDMEAKLSFNKIVGEKRDSICGWSVFTAWAPQLNWLGKKNYNKKKIKKMGLFVLDAQLPGIHSPSVHLGGKRRAAEDPNIPSKWPFLSLHTMETCEEARIWLEPVAVKVGGEDHQWMCELCCVQPPDCTNMKSFFSLGFCDVTNIMTLDGLGYGG